MHGDSDEPIANFVVAAMRHWLQVAGGFTGDEEDMPNVEGEGSFGSEGLDEPLQRQDAIMKRSNDLRQPHGSACW